MQPSLSGVLVAFLALAASLRADDWPAFRGPAGTGISAEKSAPTTWGPDRNIKWKAELPRPGFGSPIVSNGRVFVTCAEDADGGRRSIYCFDRKDGRKLWVNTIECEKHQPTYFSRNGESYCTTTPAADGQHVVVWEGTAGLTCYDFEGKKLWSRDLGRFPHKWGDGASPRIHEGKILLNCGPGKPIFMTALDVKTGKTLWQTDEPVKGNGDFNETERGHNGTWCTPTVVRVEGKEQVLCAQPTRLVAYDLESGKILWWCLGVQHDQAAHDLAYSSPVVAGEVLVYLGGFGGPGLGVRMGGSEDVTQTRRLWRLPKRPQCIGSGLSVDGYVFVPYENEIDCIDPKTGTSVWKDRGAGGGYWGSMTYAGGHVYLTNKQGMTVVFRPNSEKFELVATNRLDEEANSTPAVSNGQIFIRTFKHLYCIGE